MVSAGRNLGQDLSEAFQRALFIESKYPGAAQPSTDDGASASNTPITNTTTSSQPQQPAVPSPVDATLHLREDTGDGEEGSKDEEKPLPPAEEVTWAKQTISNFRYLRSLPQWHYIQHVRCIAVVLFSVCWVCVCCVRVLCVVHFVFVVYLMLLST